MQNNKEIVMQKDAEKIGTEVVEELLYLPYKWAKKTRIGKKDKRGDSQADPG